MYYEGDFRAGKMHGVGCLVWPDELKQFECQWESDKRKGDGGVFRYANGDRYEGDVSETFQREGQGVMQWESGDVYTGQFQADIIEGIGKKTYNDGDFYEGQWVNGKAHGIGTQCSSGNVYKGCFENGKKTGAGDMQYSDGASYTGGWRSNERSGLGEMTYCNGDVYKGFWLSDMQDGEGELTFVCGDRLLGTFCRDEVRMGTFCRCGSPPFPLSAPHYLSPLSPNPFATYPLNSPTGKTASSTSPMEISLRAPTRAASDAAVAS